MDKLEHKTITTSPFDLTYSYYLYPGFHKKLDPLVPTLLLNHGFPVDAQCHPITPRLGSAISQRFYLYHRQRCVGLVLLSLAYQVPTPEPFKLNEINEVTADRFGYP